jgi:DNA invertase Pin-like site-specific DNA recombinase
MTTAIEKFVQAMQQALADHYHKQHSEATKRGIQAAKARKELLTASS